MNLKKANWGLEENKVSLPHGSIDQVGFGLLFVFEYLKGKFFWSVMT